jgi:hypothetical protein
MLHAIGVRKHSKNKSFYKDEQEQLRSFCNSLSQHATYAASKIQASFKEAISNPSYKLCQDRLLKEFRGLASSIDAIGD